MSCFSVTHETIFFKYILWQPRIKEVKCESKGVLNGYTLPIFEIDDGSEAHWTLASASFVLLRVTLTKFPGSPLLETSADFFPMEVLSLLDFSGSSTVPLALAFFVGVWILCCSLEGFVGAWILLSSLDRNFSVEMLLLLGV